MDGLFSKSQLWFPEKNCKNLKYVKIRQNALFLFCLAVNNFDFMRKVTKKSKKHENSWNHENIVNVWCQPLQMGMATYPGYQGYPTMGYPYQGPPSGYGPPPQMVTSVCRHKKMKRFSLQSLVQNFWIFHLISRWVLELIHWVWMIHEVQVEMHEIEHHQQVI